jgi:ADP-ribose pyrophosphatase YjhB (NUDIX family)
MYIFSMKNNNQTLPVKQVFSSYDRNSTAADLAKNKFCAQCGSPNNVVTHEQTIRFVCSSCGQITFRNPLPGVSVLIEDHGKVLLGRRAKGSFAAGKWCLPCGFVEYQEDMLNAAKRETLEETGLIIDLHSIIQVTNNFHKPDLYAIVVVFYACVKSGVPTPGDDLDKLDWYPMDGPFPTFAFEADKEIISRYFLTRIAGLPLEEPQA